MSKRNKAEDAWLLDAAVQYRVEEIKSRWEVSLIFIDIQDPTHFMIKKIGDYRSKKLADIYGLNMMKTASKDVRGSIKLKNDDFDTNNN